MTILLMTLLVDVAAFHVSPRQPLHRNKLQPPLRSQTSSSFTTASTTRAIKPWPEPIVRSNGDYREEAYLEQHIGGPLYSEQCNLPLLPVPSLDQTIKQFLPTALPLAESKKEKDALLQACKDFPQQAIFLQQRLEARAALIKDSSWLQHWWNKIGYLQRTYVPF
jgi:hypothetical protein